MLVLLQLRWPVFTCPSLAAFQLSPEVQANADCELSHGDRQGVLGTVKFPVPDPDRERVIPRCDQQHRALRFSQKVNPITGQSSVPTGSLEQMSVRDRP
jgi:hypothetical protein